MAQRIKRGDQVIVTAGRSKGDKGEVLAVYEDGRLLVEGVNMVKRHQSPLRFREAGIIEKPAPIDASNVMHIDPSSGKPTRIRFEERDGEKVRVAVKSGEVIK